jgi:energy-coupling factor transport system ATP-binding protein
MLDVSALTFSYPGHPPLFSKLTFCLREKGFVVIVGSNGAGKSTLARLLLGLILPLEGRITFMGKKPQENRLQTYLIFENPDTQFVGFTLQEDILFSVSRLPAEGREEALIRALKKVGLFEKARLPVNELSGGEKELALLAGAFAASPSLLVSDEVTAYLDPISKEKAISLLKDYARKNLVIHFTSRAEEILYADTVGILNKGNLHFYQPSEILSNLSLLEKAGVEVPPWLYLSFFIYKERGEICPNLQALGRAISSIS